MEHKDLYAAGIIAEGNIKRRYAGNFFGIILSALFFAVVVVIGTMICAGGTEMSSKSYALFLASGLLCASLFVEVFYWCMDSLNSKLKLISRAGRVKGSFVLAGAFTGLLSFLPLLAAFVFVLFATTAKLSVNAIMAVPALLLLAVFSVGIGCVFAVLKALNRSLGMCGMGLAIILVLLGAIFYAPEHSSELIGKAAGYNPIFVATNILRKALLAGENASASEWIKLAAAAIVATAAGIGTFYAGKNAVLRKV